MFSFWSNPDFPIYTNFWQNGIGKEIAKYNLTPAPLLKKERGWGVFDWTRVISSFSYGSIILQKEPK